MKSVYIETYENEEIYNSLNDKYWHEGDVELLGIKYSVFGKRHIDYTTSGHIFTFELRSVV